VISVSESRQEFLARVVFLVLMAYIFFRLEARAYFRCQRLSDPVPSDLHVAERQGPWQSAPPTEP